MSSTVTYKGSTIATVSNNTNTLNTAGKYMEDNVTIVDVTQVSPVLQSKTKSYTPTESAQSETVTADSGYDGLSSVAVSVAAISSSYVGSGITRRSSSDLSASGGTITAPAGYYSSAASKAVATGTAGTPMATKGTVSNHSVSVTPSVTNSTGYITGSTKTGTAVSVSAAELVSGTLPITANGTGIDVKNYAAVDVNVSGGGSSKNAQVLQQGSTRISTSSYNKACGDLTVSKTGTYDVYWTAYRTSTSGTWGTQLYIDGEEYGSASTTFSSYYQTVHLSNVSLTSGDKLAVYGRSRGTNYYLYVGQLTIVEA